MKGAFVVLKYFGSVQIVNKVSVGKHIYPFLEPAFDSLCLSGFSILAGMGARYELRQLARNWAAPYSLRMAEE